MYQIFDTTLDRRISGFISVDAAELDANSMLVKSAENYQHGEAIVNRCVQLQNVWYSIPARTDCESLQGFIHCGREEDRHSSQVQGALGVAALALIAGWWFGDGGPGSRA
jgi:hypothetical protein